MRRTWIAIRDYRRCELMLASAGKRAVAAAVALVAVMAATETAAAATMRARLRTMTIRVNSRYTEPGSQIGGLACHGLESPPPKIDTCRGHAVGPVTFTGTMWGDAWYDEAGWIEPDGTIRYGGADYVHGGVRHCGSGSYTIETYDGYIDMKRYDPATGSAPGFNRWRIRPGTGTRELTNLVSGQGVNHWRAYFSWYAGAAAHFGEGLFTGTITCRI